MNSFMSAGWIAHESPNSSDQHWVRASAVNNVRRKDDDYFLLVANDERDMVWVKAKSTSQVQQLMEGELN